MSVQAPIIVSDVLCHHRPAHIQEQRIIKDVHVHEVHGNAVFGQIRFEIFHRGDAAVITAFSIDLLLHVSHIVAWSIIFDLDIDLRLCINIVCKSQEFIKSIVRTIRELNEAGIEDSIVLGFDIYLESVKKAKNSDLLAAITSIDEADATFGKVTHARFTADPNAATMNMSDDEFRKIWKYSYKDVVKWCKENIEGFKQAVLFHSIKREAEQDINYAYKRRLDNQNIKSASKTFYTDECLKYIKREYLLRMQEELKEDR